MGLFSKKENQPRYCLLCGREVAAGKCPACGREAKPLVPLSAIGKRIPYAPVESNVTANCCGRTMFAPTFSIEQSRCFSTH